MSKDYAEILLQAVDTLYNKRVESIKFDTTDSATIIERVDADKGKYVVSTGTTKYVAYSVNTDYRVGDNVYVTIPNGDYEQQKIIIGKKVTNNSQPFVYTAPFDTIVNISENLIPKTADIKGGLRANCYYDLSDQEIQHEIDKENGEIQKKIWERTFTTENLIGYTRLGIQGQFMSWLYHWRVISGDYGLKLVVTYKTHNAETYAENYNETLYKLNNILNNTSNIDDLAEAYQNALTQLINTAAEQGWYDTQRFQEEKFQLMSSYQNNARLNDWNWIINNSYVPIENTEFTNQNITELIETTQDLLNNLEGTRTFLLNCSEFYGDPYNFSTYFQQETVFDLTSLGSEAQITKMELYFYQIPGTFFRQNEQPVPYKPDNSPFGDQETSLLDYNLFVKDPYICLGFGVGEFNDDDVSLYTIDSLSYGYKELDEYTEEDWLKKTIQLRWIHKYPDGTISEVKNNNNENLPELNYEIRWYRYENGAPSPDSYVEAGWKRINRGPGSSKLFSYVLSVNNGNELNYKLPEERFKVIILLYALSDDQKQYCTDVYRSNVLTFVNDNEVISQTIVDQINGFFLQTNDNNDGNYFVYGQSGEIKEQPDSKQIRQLQCFFKPSNRVNAELLTNATKIIWRFPASNTMLNLADMFISPAETYGWLKDAKTRNIDEVEWEIAPSFTINEYGHNAQNYVLNISDSSQGQVNSDIIYHIAWSKVCYDANTDEYVIGYKGDPNFAYFINPCICYTINSNYIASYTSNTISCTIEKDGITYTAYKTMRFGPAGTNGSRYNLVVEFDDKNNTSFALTNYTSEMISVSAHLFDENGIEITEHNGKYEWRWLPSDIGKDIANDYIQIFIDENHTEKQDVIKLHHEADVNLFDDILPYLECKLTHFGSYSLITVVPIAIRSSEKYMLRSGPTKVAYQSTGYPRYYSGPYTLSESIDGDDGWRAVTDGEWSIYNPDNVLDNFLGQIRSQNDTLQPCGIYVEDAGQYGVKYSVPSEEENVDDTIFWIQPIYCSINMYPSETLNEWDGKGIEIDEDNSTIVAPAIAAGKKNSDNTFSGVMLGDWRKVDTEESISKVTGVYGLDHGSVSYAFMEDGTAFIGKSGMGRIHFDGNSSTIESEAYQQLKNGDMSTGGMSLDLDDGIIDIKGTIKRARAGTEIDTFTFINNEDGKGYYQSNNIFTSSGSQVKIQAADPYFIVKTESYEGNPGNTTGNEIIHVGAGEYFLQSDNYWSGTNNAEIAYTPVSSDEVDEHNFSNYYIQYQDTFTIDDNLTMTSGREYYLTNTQNAVPITMYPSYRKNQFFTHYVIDTSSEYDSNKEYFTFNEETGVFTSRLNSMFINNYEPNIYYYRTYLGYKLATGEYNKNVRYYNRESDDVFVEVNLVDMSQYSPDTYYYKVGNNYILDENLLPTENIDYYSRSVFYEGFSEADLTPNIEEVYSNDNFEYNSEEVYYLYDENEEIYNEVQVNELNHYSSNSLTQYCIYDNFSDSYVVISSEELNSQIESGIEYYLKEPEYVYNTETGENDLIFNYTYVGYIYFPSVYYTIIENINTPSNFLAKQANSELYLQSYIISNLEWREDIKFYNGNHQELDEEAFNNTQIHYIKYYYLNTDLEWHNDIVYYEKDLTKNIYQYDLIGKLYVITYEPNTYYIKTNDNSQSLYIDYIITLNNNAFLQEINDDSSQYIFRKTNNNNILKVYVLDNSGEEVLIYYNSYTSNYYYYYNENNYGLYKGNTYQPNYSYYENNIGSRCYFYIPGVYYYKKRGYKQADSYNINTIYYKDSIASGTRIDINNGEIKSYNLRLVGYQYENINGEPVIRDIAINSNRNITYPLKIGVWTNEAGTTETFKVDWNGKLWSTAANIGGWQVTSDSIVSAGYDVTKLKEEQDNPYILLNSEGSIEANYSSVNGTGWKITKEGDAYFNQGNIAGWTINKDGIQKYTDGNTKWYGMMATTPDGWADVFLGAWNSTNGYVFKVDHNGKLTATNADVSGTINVKTLKIDGQQVQKTPLTIPVRFEVVPKTKTWTEITGSWEDTGYTSYTTSDRRQTIQVPWTSAGTNWSTGIRLYKKSGNSYVAVDNVCVQYTEYGETFTVPYKYTAYSTYTHKDEVVGYTPKITKVIDVNGWTINGTSG